MLAVPPLAQPEVKLAIFAATSLFKPVAEIFRACGAANLSDLIAGCTTWSLLTRPFDSAVKSGGSDIWFTSTVPPSSRIMTACNNADTVSDCAREKYSITLLLKDLGFSCMRGALRVVAFIVTEFVD